MKSFLTAIMTFVGLYCTAQTADEIINKYVAAMGGAEKLSSLKTVKMEGSMSTQGIEFPLTITKKHLAGMRLDMEIMGTSNFQLANTTRGWVFMPVMQQTEPKEMDAEQMKTIQSQMDVQGTLFNYKEKGYTVEMAGTEKIDGKDAYKLKVVQNGKNVFYFIDAVSNLIVKTASKTNVQGNDMEVETSFSDYKKNADGYLFAYTNVTTQGTISFDKISTNIPVDEKIFSN